MKKSTHNIQPEEILKHIKPARLKQFIIDYGANHPEFMENFMANFSPGKSSEIKEDYSATILQAFGSNELKPGNRYHNHGDFGFDSESVADDLQPLLDKTGYFIKHKNYDEAIVISCTLIETIPDEWNPAFDYDGDVQVIYDTAISNLQEMLEQKLLSTEQKKALFNWYSAEYKNEKHLDVGLNTDLGALEKFFTDTPEMLQQNIKNIDERIANAGEDYHRQSAVLDKVQLLQNAGMDDEAEIVITQYLVFARIRKLRVQKLIQKKQYQEAVRLISDGIEIAERNRYPGQVSDWKDDLLCIYLLQKDKGKIISTAGELFYDGRESMKYYRILKKNIEKEKWAAYLDTLLTRHKNRSMLGRPDQVLAQIYIEEQYWDRLLHIVQKSELNGLQEYEKHLKAHFPEEVRNLFAQKITQYADRNMGRDHYQLVAYTLKKIRTYPGGNEVVDKLLAEFKMKYKARKAMMEELGGV